MTLEEIKHISERAFNIHFAGGDATVLILKNKGESDIETFMKIYFYKIMGIEFRLLWRG